MNPLGFFSGLLHSTEQLVGHVAHGVAQTVGNFVHSQQQPPRPAPTPQPARPAPKPAPRVNLNALKNALANVHLQGIEQLTGHPVTVGSVVQGAGDMVNQGVVQPINRGQQALYKLETGQPINARQFVSDAATTGLNFATLGKGKAALEGAGALGAKVAAGLREGATLGGASGAAQTFANPNATVKDYARAVATGAAVGAGAGAAAPVVGRGIRIAGSAVKNAPKVLASEAGHIAIPGAVPNPKVPRPGMTFEQFKAAHAGDAKAMAAQLGVEVPKVPKPDRQLRKVFDATVAKMKVDAPPVVKAGKSAKVVAPPAIEAPAMKSVGEIMAERGTIPPRSGARNPGVIPSVSPQAVVPPAAPGAFKIAPESKVGGVPNMSDAGLPAGTAPSRFDRRIAADPRASEDLQASMMANGTHQVLGNEQTVTAARSRVAASEDQAYGYAVRGQGTEANATAMELLAKYLNAGDFEKADELTRAVSPRFTKTGQQMQILAAYSRLTPAGAVRYATQQLEKASVNLPDRAKAVMTPELAQEISAMAEHIQSLPEGSQERGYAAAEMMQHIAKQIPSSASDKLIGIWKAGLLTGLKTQTGNAVGNAGNAAIKKISDAPAALIDKAFSFFTKQRTKTFTVKGLGSGAKEGVGHGIKFLKTGIDERNLTATKLDTKQLNYKNPIINSYVNGVFKLMGAADRPAYYAALRNNMQDIALAAGKTKGLGGADLKSFVADFVKNPPDDAVETAVNAADKAVFANDTFLSDLAAGLRGKASKYPGGSAAIQIIMPFTKVPSSVITQVFDYTPTGTVKAIVGQILKGKFDQRAMSEAIGKSATGTIGFISAGVALANAGLLTGAYPKDPKEQQAWKAEGKTPNSILIGGKWRSLNYLAPVGPLLGMGQNISQASKEGANAMGQVTAAVTGGVQTALGQSFLQGVQGILDAVNDPSRYGLSTAKNMVSSVVPTGVGDFAKATDSLQRQTNGIIDAVKAKIPGLRQTLAPQIDAFGNQLERPNSAAGTLLDPVRSSKTTSTPLFSELDRLQAAGQGVYPTPDKTIQVGTTTVKLTPAQATAYNKAVGQAVQKLWGEITTSKEYGALPDDKKKLALQGALDDIRTLEKQKVLRNDPALEGQYGTLSDKIKLTSRQMALASDKVQPVDYINASAGKATNPKSKYEQNLAAYKKNKAEGKLTAAADLKAQDSLAKEAVTSKYSQEVLDFYSLSNTQKQAFFKSNPDAAKKLYDQAKQLDSELVGGTVATSRFAKGGGLKVTGTGKDRKGKKPPKPRLPKLRLARVGRIPNLKMPRAKAVKSTGLKVASVKKLSLTA